MSGNYLLDTSVLIELFAQDKDILARLAKAKSTFIPSIALGELHYGARKSSRTEKNLEQLEQLATKVVILPAMQRQHIGMALSRMVYENLDSPSLKMISGSRQSLYNMGLLWQRAISTSKQWKT